MASDGRQKPNRGRALRIPFLALAAAALLLAAFAASAGAEVVYDNSPTAGAAEAPAVGLAETGTAELGSLVRLGGSARLDPTVRVALVGSCEALTAPVTLSLYAANPDRTPGALLARRTEAVALAAGPDPQPVAFAFPGVSLPDEVIVSVATAAAAVQVALAGPPAAGANPREAEGVYRAAVTEGVSAPLAFEAEPLAWGGLQPAFAIEASPPAPVGAPAVTTVATPTTRTLRREFVVPPSKRMIVSFPTSTARIAGPGVLIQVRCTGSSAARCIGTISLSAAGTVHKAPFSIGKGRREYVVVPLGSDLELLDGLDAARGTVTASTIQVGGASVRTKRALRFK